MRALLLAPVVVVLLSQFDGEEPAATPAQIVSTVADAGTLARADDDLYANTFIASNLAPDGGSGHYGYVCASPTCRWKLAEGTQMEMIASGNSLTMNVSALNLATAFIQQPANPNNTNVRWIASAGKWFGLYPTADLTGCAADTEGGMKSYSTTHGLRYCDGTTVQTVALALVNTASIDFDNMVDGADGSKTMTVSGATTSDVVTCSPTGGDPEAGLMHRYDRVTAANTVTLVRRNQSGGDLNPAAINYTCVVTRAP